MQRADLTKDSIPRSLAGIAAPVFLTQLVTQLYTTVDSIIVGRYVGESGLAAIGVTYQIILFTVSLGIGFLMGISVMTGECAGARDSGRMRQTLAVSVYFVLFTWLVKLIVALFLARKILLWTHTPPTVIDDGAHYLRIVFTFGLFTFGYSMCTYVLRALGDAVRPMYFLFASSGMNVALDLLFVGRFGWGVPGAAYATVISESCAFFGCLIYMYRQYPSFRLRRRDFRDAVRVLRYALRLSVPSSLQMCAVTMSSILVQAAVNQYGTHVVAGLTAAQKIEQILTLLISAEGTALMTFVSQNRSAGLTKRVGHGFRMMLSAALLTALFSTVLVLLLRRPTLGLFLRSGAGRSAALAAGMRYFLCTAPFYVLLAGSQILGNYLRGMADAAAPLWIGAAQVGANLLAILALEPVLGVSGIWISVPLGWGMSVLVARLRLPIRRDAADS